MSEIDVPVAGEILPSLADPRLAEREAGIRRADPALSPDEVLDLALTEAVLELRYTLNRQTFEYLKWKVVAARANLQAAREASAAARAERATAGTRPPRRFHDADWELWSVTEVPGNARSRAGARCLIFESPSTVRRVWDFPENWRDLSDSELSTISWNR